jgi:hypothetical protein
MMRTFERSRSGPPGPSIAIARRRLTRSGRQESAVSLPGPGTRARPPRSPLAPDDPPGPARSTTAYPPTSTPFPGGQDRRSASAPYPRLRAARARGAHTPPKLRRGMEPAGTCQCACNPPPGILCQRVPELPVSQGNAAETYFSTSTPRQKATYPLILRAAGFGSG